jgi:ABC-type multidrug transport system fused ATPase/permease subunit
MEDGRIIERGSHEELMAGRGVYYEMVVRQMQSSSQNVEEVFR